MLGVKLGIHTASLSRHIEQSHHAWATGIPDT
jgi:hypothetical protein